MPTKATESLEVIAALVVTAGLVSGNLFLFSPLRTDNRVKASPPPARSGEAAHPESSTKASIDGNFDPAASRADGAGQPRAFFHSRWVGA